MLIETLRADWAARGTTARVSAIPTFERGALLLGVTKLASAGDEAAQAERAVALATVATGRPLDPSAATHVRRALAKARGGDAPLALTHLALAGVGRLEHPSEDARGLFMADGLMRSGVPPGVIVALLGEPPPDGIERAYDPDQPRVARRKRATERPVDEWR